jgi:hypothetical protein
MSEEKFEIECFFKLTETCFVPFLLQITRGNVVISAKTQKDKEPHPCAIGENTVIDNFLHQFPIHNYSGDCEYPERISIFELRSKRMA